MEWNKLCKSISLSINRTIICFQKLNDVVVAILHKSGANWKEMFFRSLDEIDEIEIIERVIHGDFQGRTVTINVFFP